MTAVRIVIYSIFALLVPCGAAAGAVPGEIVVRYAPGASTEELHDLVDARSARAAAVPSTEVLRVAPDRTTSAVRALAARGDVIWAEPNRRYRLTALPADRLFPDQWALRNVGQAGGLIGADIDALAGWQLTTGSAAVTVAVIDSGVRPEHPDLVGQLLPGADFTGAGDGPRDNHGHGTAVTGIVAARADAEGTIGVAPGVRVLPLQAFASDGIGAADEIAQAIAYAGANGARIANLSFSGQYSNLIAEAVYGAPGTLFVAAAGNDARDVDGPREHRGYPCRLPFANVVCVAASTADDAAADFTNTGPVSVDIAAPGRQVLAPALSDDVILADDFEAALGGRWITGGPEPGWQRSATGEGHALTIAPRAADPPGTERWIQTGGALTDEDWGAGERCHLELDVDHEPRPGDWLEVQRQYNGAWHYFTDFFGESGRFHVSYEINSGHFTALRFVLRTNVGDATDRPGVRLDNLLVTCGGERATADTWRPVDGTSFAAPHAAGVAALALSARPALSTGQLRSSLLCGAEPLAGLAGTTVSGGRLDVPGALAARIAPERPRTSGVLTPAVPYVENWGLAAMPDGGFVFSEPYDHVVRRMLADGRVVPFAGNGEDEDTGDGGPATTAGVWAPGHLLTRADGGVYVLGATRLRFVRADGTIVTLAGGANWGHTGDGGPASAALLDRPVGLGEGPDGSIYIAESAGAIRRIDPAGVITTVASLSGYIYAFTVEPDGALLVAFRERIVRVRPGSEPEPVAGNGLPGWSGDGGPAVAARIKAPYDLEVAPDGIYVADGQNGVIRKIGRDGRIDTVAGIPELWGVTETATPALAARLGDPRAVAVLASADLAVGTSRGIYRLDRARMPVPPLPPACAGEGPPEQPEEQTPDEPTQSDKPAPGDVAPTSPLPRPSPKAAGRDLRVRAARLRGRRLSLRLTCGERCTARVRVVARPRGGRPRTAGSVRRRLAAGNETTVVVRLRRNPMRRLRRAGGRLVVRVEAGAAVSLLRIAVRTV